MLIFDSTDVLKGISILGAGISFAMAIFSFRKYVARKQKGSVAEWTRPRPELDREVFATLISRRQDKEGRIREQLSDSFYLNRAHPSTTTVEYFEYLMVALDWPIVKSTRVKNSSIGEQKFLVVEFQAEKYYSRSIFIWSDGERYNDQIMKLHESFQGYQNDGCPYYSELPEPIETIVSRARGIEPMDNMTKFGYTWGKP